MTLLDRLQAQAATPATPRTLAVEQPGHGDGVAVKEIGNA